MTAITDVVEAENDRAATIPVEIATLTVTVVNVTETVNVTENPVLDVVILATTKIMIPVVVVENALVAVTANVVVTEQKGNVLGVVVMIDVNAAAANVVVTLNATVIEAFQENALNVCISSLLRKRLLANHVLI